MSAPDLVVAAGSALLCGASGLFVAPLIAKIPEPEAAPVPEPAGDGSASPPVEGAPPPGPTHAGEPPKQPYAEIAASSGLRARAVVTAAVAGALLGLGIGWAWPLLFWLPLVPVGVALAVVDLRTKLLPRRVVLPAHAGVLLLAVVSAAAEGDPAAYVRGLVGMVVVRSVFWVLWWLRSAGMGFGDVRLSALLAFALGYLGWGELLVGSYAGFLLFGVPGLALALLRRDRALLRTAYPFGPAMLAGAVLGVLVGPALWGHLAIG